MQLPSTPGMSATFPFLLPSASRLISIKAAARPRWQDGGADGEARWCKGGGEGGLDENEWTSGCDNAMEIEDARGPSLASPRLASVLGRSLRGGGRPVKLFSKTVKFLHQ